MIITKKKFRLSKPDLMLSSSLRNQIFSVDMRPLLTGEAHGDNKSHSSGIVALDLSPTNYDGFVINGEQKSDLSDALRWICHEGGFAKSVGAVMR